MPSSSLFLVVFDSMEMLHYIDPTLETGFLLNDFLNMHRHHPLIDLSHR